MSFKVQSQPDRVSLSDFLDNNHQLSQAFTEAVKVCKATKRALYIPPGDYLIGEEGHEGAVKIDVQKRGSAQATSVMYLSGISDLNIVFDKNAFFRLTTGFMTRNSLVVLGIDNCRNLNISGLQLRGDQKPNSENILGVVIRNSENVQIQDFNLENLGSGIRLADSKDVKIISASVKDCFDTGVNFFSKNEGCSLVNSLVEGCGDGNATMYAGNLNCSFVSCTFRRASQLAAIESSSHCKITGCIFDGVNDLISRNGPILNRSQYCMIKDNMIMGVQNGIIIRETDITDVGGTYNYGHIIEGNQIFSLTRKRPDQLCYGLLIDYSSSIKIVNNTLANVQGPNIRIADLGKKKQKGSGSNSSIIISGNHFVTKNSHTGDGFRSQKFNLQEAIFIWSEEYALEGLTFSENTIVADASNEKFLLQITEVKNSNINNNTSLDPNLDNAPMLFMQFDKMDNVNISGNHGGKIICKEANYLIMSNNHLNNWKKQGACLGFNKLENSMIQSNIFEGNFPIRVTQRTCNTIINNNIFETVAKNELGKEENNIVRDNIEVKLNKK